MEKLNPALLDWDDLKVFYYVAREGSLTAAAPLLKLSQPTLGRRLRHLEDRCGFSLFQRSANRLTLTDEGEVVFQHAKSIDEKYMALLRQLAGATEDLEGTLRLSASDWFSNCVLSEPVTQFSISNPLITVEILTDFRLLNLERREADLLLRFVKFTSPGIIQRKFTHVRYGLFAGQHYLDRVGYPNDQDGGAGHQLVTMDSQFDEIADLKWLRHHLPNAHLGVRSNSRELQALACKQGAGLSVLPVVLGTASGLVEIELFGRPPGKDIWMGYHADLKRLGRLRLLIDHLIETVPGAI